MGFFPAVPWLHFRPLVLISALADCKFPPYCTLEPARGWLLENPVPRKVRKVSPRSVRFFTLLIMRDLYILLARSSHKVEQHPVRMSCVVPLRDQKEKSISESTLITLGGCNRGVVRRNIYTL